MAIQETEIKHIAQLARIHIKPCDMEKIRNDFNRMLGLIETICLCDTSGIESSDSHSDHSNVLRPDIPGDSLCIEKIESLAPEFSGGHIVVPSVLD